LVQDLEKINMTIIRHRKIFFALSALLLLGSIFAWILVKPSYGTDFTGGSILEVHFDGEVPDLAHTKEHIEALGFEGVSIRPSGESNIIIRTKEITTVEKDAIITELTSEGDRVTEERFNLVGPVVGESLKKKSIWAIAVVILCIVLFITFAFRKVSQPVSSWKYGFATVVALLHDVVIPAGAYVIYGKYFSAEIDLLFVTGILAILGYSVHDTIVVFDRVREHLKLNQEGNVNEPFEKTVGESLMQTLGRSINTSVTIFLVLVALYFVGSEATKSFSFLLAVGVVIGTYSSIFLASPLLVTLEKLKKNK
jgi:preprotein translocase subunit SecF